MSVLEDSKYQSGDPVRPEDCPSNFIISPDTRREDRIPPGQSRTRKWPVLDAFGPPLVDLADWQLRVFGLVERPLTLTRADFNALRPFNLDRRHGEKEGTGDVSLCADAGFGNGFFGGEIGEGFAQARG